MNLTDLGMVDLFGILVGLVFTLFVFSYILGDNFLFRLAIHIFIGVAAGFAVVVAWNSVIFPQLIDPLFNGSRETRLYLVFPLLLSLLLLAKASTRLAGLGNIAMAILVGIAAATAIGGAVLGTIFPQTDAATRVFAIETITRPGTNPLLNLFEGGLVLVGTVTSLAFFHFGRRANDPAGQRHPIIEWIARVGQVFIVITFGVLFAGVYAAALTALVERLSFLTSFVTPFLP